MARPGARIALTDLPGDGHPVVLTHGAGMDRSAFTDIARDLNDAGHRVLLWDLRGHAQSALEPGARFSALGALDDLDALIVDRGLERPVLVGHSLGGNLSQALVRRHPKRARGLVVIGSTSNTGPLTAFERFALRRLSGPALALIPASRLPGMLARASATTTDAITRLTALFDRMPKHTFLDVWHGTADLVEPDPTYRTPVPLTLIRGEKDDTGNIAAAMTAWAERDDAAVHVIPGAGHVVMWDAPAATSTAVRAAVAAMTA